MNIRLIRIATLLMIAISTFAPAQSQTNYNQPRKISFDRLLRRTFPQYYGSEEYRTLIEENFYPIGWSRDGKFAYYVEPPDEACGCYFAELVIQDLRTDKEVWKFKNDPESRMNAKGEIIEDDMRRLWQRNKKMFSAKLREHGIIPLARFVLLGRSFSVGRKTYTATVNTRKAKDNEYDMERITEMTTFLRTPSLGSKSIFNIEYKAKLDWFAAPLDVTVAGAFKSPYENRVAIVMISVFRGWEGPPHPTDNVIVGADLDKGFRIK